MFGVAGIRAGHSNLPRDAAIATQNIQTQFIHSKQQSLNTVHHHHHHQLPIKKRTWEIIQGHLRHFGPASAALSSTTSAGARAIC